MQVRFQVLEVYKSPLKKRVDSDIELLKQGTMITFPHHYLNRTNITVLLSCLWKLHNFCQCCDESQVIQCKNYNTDVPQLLNVTSLFSVFTLA